MVSISPSQGSLEAGEATVCKVTFTAAGVPSFYDLDLVCEITDLNDLCQYRKELTAWEAERQRQSVEFTITEDNLYADSPLPDTDVRHPLEIYSDILQIANLTFFSFTHDHKHWPQNHNLLARNPKSWMREMEYLEK